MECCLALAMGIPVGIVTNNNGEPAKLLDDPFWMATGAVGAKNLQAITADVESIRTFLGGKAVDE